MKTTTPKVVAVCFALMLPTSAFAMPEADCLASWTKADANGDGKLSGGEGADYYVGLQAAQKPVAADSMTKDMFMQNCKSDTFVMAQSATSTAQPAPNAANSGPAAKVDDGAPLSGANSFTENQAKDRVTAAGFSSVSTLKKDDNGVWRGTAVRDTKTMNIAVDFKGNVVSN